MADPEKSQTHGEINDQIQTDRTDHVEDLKKTITVDTLHHDEGLKVLANYQGDETWSDVEEKKLLKKIDRRLLSIVVTTYGLQYYDKAMLSQAVRIRLFPRPLAITISWLTFWMRRLSLVLEVISFSCMVTDIR